MSAGGESAFKQATNLICDPAGSDVQSHQSVKYYVAFFCRLLAEFGDVLLPDINRRFNQKSKSFKWHPPCLPKTSEESRDRYRSIT